MDSCNFHIIFSAPWGTCSSRETKIPVPSICLEVRHVSIGHVVYRWIIGSRRFFTSLWPFRCSCQRGSPQSFGWTCRSLVRRAAGTIELHVDSLAVLLILTGLMYLIKTFKYKKIQLDGHADADDRFTPIDRLPRPSISTQTSVMGINNDQFSVEQEMGKKN